MCVFCSYLAWVASDSGSRNDHHLASPEPREKAARKATLVHRNKNAGRVAVVKDVRCLFVTVVLMALRREGLSARSDLTSGTEQD
ncbi:unnamed protein product [Leptosia nina]|uniref:Secreted protein n=1 Tax=Leptosia nina TaxID=320188 RepID=A0AAV1J323_9NEOP